MTARRGAATLSPPTLDPRFVARRRGVERDYASEVQGDDPRRVQKPQARILKHVLTGALRAAWLHGRARRNAAQVELRHHVVRSRRVPAAFDGFRVLHLSDFHADISGPALARAHRLVADTAADLCVFTGDLRGAAVGPFEAALAAAAPIIAEIEAPLYAVLGNHDSIGMVAPLEALGVSCLINRAVPLRRGGDTVWLAGVDDAHFYRTDNLDEALAEVPYEAFTILLSHTPELWRQAAHSAVDIMLSGHTHGGQLCLPGGIPLILSAKRLPRRMARGPWRHHELIGYTSAGCGTSLVPVRLNCPPEITLHTLKHAATPPQAPANSER